MFNIDDEKRPVPRASLLDFVAEDTRGSARAKNRAAGASATNSSLLNRTSAAAGSAGHSSARVAAQPQIGGKTAKETKGSARHRRTLSGMGDRLVRWLADGQSDDTQAASTPAAANFSDRPLVDIKTVLRSVWQLRKIIIATTALGAVGGVLIALSTPSVYVAESKLYVDPVKCG